MFLLQGCNKKTQGWRSRREASAQRALARLARGQRPGANYVFCIWGRRNASSSASRAWRKGCNKKTQGWRSRRGASAQRALARLARGQRPGPMTPPTWLWSSASSCLSCSSCWRHWRGRGRGHPSRAAPIKASEITHTGTPSYTSGSVIVACHIQNG